MKEADFFLCDYKDLQKINAHNFAKNNYFQKAKHTNIYIKNLSSIAANILKQECIAIGANLLNDEESIINTTKKVNCILNINQKQIGQLQQRLKLQDFHLKKLANFLSTIKIQETFPKIMGILNINDDSFYENSRTSKNNFLDKAYEMLENNACILDIGAMSSRPKSKYQGQETEMARLKDIFKLIKSEKLYEKCILSIDTFVYEIAKTALDNGFKIINDISANTNLSNLCKEYDATYILMHSQNNYINAYLNNEELSNIHFDDKFAYLNYVFDFFKKKLEEINSKCIIDVGIGFGKNEFENLVLVKYLEHFKSLNKELLLAASNKGFINKNTNISLYLHAICKADYIRVHNVKEQNELINYIKKVEQI